MELLHVYASESPHSEVYIAGTANALKELKKAIDQALDNDKSVSEEFFTNDGEGYSILVAVVDESTISSYVEPYAELQCNGPGPWLLFR
jgi:hypothetical protein